MKAIAKIALAIGLLALATFGIFGFLAAAEVMGQTQIYWKIGYALLAVGSLGGAFASLRDFGR